MMPLTRTEAAVAKKQWPIGLDQMAAGRLCGLCLEERWNFGGTMKDGQLLVCISCWAKGGE